MSNIALDLAIAYQKKREERLALDKQVAKLAEQEAELKVKFMVALENSGVKSVGNGIYNYAVVTKMEPQVDDWATLYEHIKQTGHFELLFRRINPAAVKERWENQAPVPGVGAFPVDKVSITKAKGA